MNILRYTKGLVIIIVLCSGVFLFNEVRAYSITANPYFKEIQVQSGERISGSFELIMKESGAPKKFVVTTHNFIVKEDGKTPEIVSPDKADPDITPWIIMKDNGAYLVNDAPVAMKYEVSVPVGTPSGTYHAGFRVTSQRADGTGDSVLGRMFLPVFITVDKEKAQRGISIKQFYTQKNILFGNPLILSTVVKNTGTTDERPYGDLKVTNLFGNTVGRLFLNEELGRVLPGSPREFKTNWDGAGDWYRFGKYKVSLTYSSSGDIKTPIQDLNVWIFSPAMIIIIVCVIICVLGSVFIYKRKKQKKK